MDKERTTETKDGWQNAIKRHIKNYDGAGRLFRTAVFFKFDHSKSADPMPEKVYNSRPLPFKDLAAEREIFHLTEGQIRVCLSFFDCLML